MRNLLILLFLVLTLAACGGGGGGDVPTLVPTVGSTSQDGSEGDGGAPRITPDSGLPPTWTPAPTTVPATVPPAVGPGTPSPSGGADTYTVQAGDTLAEIAARYNVTVADLADANDIENIDVIEVGQVLVIP